MNIWGVNFHRCWRGDFSWRHFDEFIEFGAAGHRVPAFHDAIVHGILSIFTRICLCSFLS